MTTSIEWVKSKEGIQGVTWNPLAGCTPVSSGCANCYAALMSMRLEAMALQRMAAGTDPGKIRKYIGLTKKVHGKAVFNGKINLDTEALKLPAQWKKPRTIFVNSMSDLFHENVPDEFICKVFEMMTGAGKQHTYQILTKRPDRALKWYEGLKQWKGWTTWNDMMICTSEEWPAPQIMLGVSCENQKTANERLPILQEIPAVTTFISFEPLLGAIDGTDLFFTHQDGQIVPLVDWVIIGGESGPHARPMHPDWARSLVDQSQAAGVNTFFKQWGNWVPRDQFEWSALDPNEMNEKGITVWPDGRTESGQHGTVMDGSEVMWHVSKHIAGRMLDGVLWDQLV